MIREEKENQIHWIRMNRPEKRNALSPELVDQLKRSISKAYEDQNVKVLILTGEGNAFCSGADLEFLQKMQDFNFDENLEDSNNLKDLFTLIYDGPKPVIAAVNGHAIAGGAGLASICDFTITIPEAKFGFTEVKIGFIPALVSVFLVRKIGESAARELLLSGRIFKSEEAYELGMVHKVVEKDRLEEEVRALASILAYENSSESLKATKRLLSAIADKGLKESLDLAAQMNAEARGTNDCKEGVSAFLEKRKPDWTKGP